MSELGAVERGCQVQDPEQEHVPRAGKLQGGQCGWCKREPNMVEIEELGRGQARGR